MNNKYFDYRKWTSKKVKDCLYKYAAARIGEGIPF